MNNGSIVRAYSDSVGRFDDERAWYEWALPRVVALPENALLLLRSVALVASTIVQDRYLDLPWPDASDCDAHPELAVTLQEEFAKVDVRVLAEAGRAVYAFGHWKPADPSATRIYASIVAYDDGRRPSDPPRTHHVSPEDVDRMVRLPKRFPGATWKFAMYANQSVRERSGLLWRGRASGERRVG